MRCYGCMYEESAAPDIQRGPVGGAGPALSEKEMYA